MDINQHQWQAVQNQLKEEVGESGFNSWLSPLKIESENNGIVTLSVPTRFMRDWIVRHYTDIIEKHIQNSFGKELKVDYIIRNDQDAMPGEVATPKPEAPVAKPVTDALYQGNTLDPKYTFENYVTGKSNEFAYAAAMRIAESDDMAYNPFFLYGGVGLGKTHLMHAIAHHIRVNWPGRRVLYISAEKFLFQFIRALRDKNTISFKETFRNVDVLMIDDVQFIAGKEATQEEFFHTFNALVDMRKQIILTADRSPHEMANIEDRLRSRLGSGLATEIHAPDLETRLAILQKKADRLGMDLPRDVSMFLADRITSNIRELEGALNRLAAHADLIGAPITVDFAKEQLKDLFRAYERIISIEDIQKKVADYYHIKIADMHSARRNRAIARPRQIAMYLAKQVTTRSFPEIGRSFGGRDHTTVIHAVRTIENLVERDRDLEEDVKLLESMLTNG